MRTRKARTVGLTMHQKRRLLWKSDRMVSRMLMVRCYQPCEMGEFFIQADIVDSYRCDMCGSVPYVVDDTYPEAGLDGIPCPICNHRNEFEEEEDWGGYSSPENQYRDALNFGFRCENCTQWIKIKDQEEIESDTFLYSA